MAAGERRGGDRRTDAERKVRHKKLYGTTQLPPRGTGLGMGQGMMNPPTTRPPLPAALMRRTPVMRAKGMPLAGFAPAPGKKAVRRGKKVRKQLAI